ncbi:MAG: hypothetical protein ACF8R7_06245 [Phycisphaerales bacterium JB039]
MAFSSSTLDGRGRVTLGPRFAGEMVICPVPERGAWLCQNAESRSAVRRGLEQARRRQFAEPPT